MSENLPDTAFRRDQLKQSAPRSSSLAGLRVAGAHPAPITLPTTLVVRESA
ncbi:hypothetical protein [Microbacterium sp. B35-04]|uniref:hypothetical protein n=1 Tax=Microbacterium sp. B35-04 TaxID=1961716 RepID=UPI0013D7AE2C|nr:hypothetical protein [Microbacterium sp. B35-04]